MELEKAKVIASEVIRRLAPYCSRIEVAGSIRRKKSEVKDVDIVLIPSDPWNLEREVNSLARPFTPKLSGDKLKRFNYTGGVQVDLYFPSEETWATLLLIRTGSKEFNRMLATRAIDRGLRLKADGQGVMRGSEVIANESEEAILRVLGLPYLEPRDREIPLPRGAGS